MRPHSYKGLLAVAIRKRIHELLGENPDLRFEAARDQAKREMLAHCPLNPPRDGKCAINSLSDELLVHVFALAWEMELDERTFDEEEYDKSILKDSSGDREKGGSGNNSNVNDDMEADDEDGNNGMSVGSSTTKAELVTPLNVTHVCSRWRRVAIDTPSLWTYITFEQCVALEQHKTFLERAKSSLIDIEIEVLHVRCNCGRRTRVHDRDPKRDHSMHRWECQRLETEFVQCLLQTVDHNDPTLPTLLGQEDWYTGSYIHELGDPPERCVCCNSHYTFSEFSEILDLLISRLQYWRCLQVKVLDYRFMYLLLARLHQCEPPNNLEELRLIRAGYHVPGYPFKPPRLAASFVPFRGIMPNLKFYAFNGVHIDWDACVPVLGNVKVAMLANHVWEVRPSLPTFAKMVQPLRGLLSLTISGPKGNENHWRAIGMTRFVLPQLKRLALWDMDVDYCTSVLRFLDMPNLKAFKLGPDPETNSLDADEFVDVLCDTSRVSSKSLLAGLEHFDTTLDCRRDLMIRMLEQLGNLKSLELRSDIGEVTILDPLHECKPSTPGQKVYCPLLESLSTGAIHPWNIVDIVEARANAGAPLKRVSLHFHGLLDADLEKEMKALVEKFEYGPFEVDEEE